MTQNLIIGGSTGCLYRIFPARNTHENISQNFALPSARAIEFMFHDKEDMEYTFTQEDLRQFSHCSMHVPKHAYQNDEWSHKIFGQLEEVCKKFPIKNIVIHPDEVVDWSFLDHYKHLPLSIENMDERKASCQGVEDLQKIFHQCPYLKFVLDLQHCFVNDSTMQLAKDLHKAFGDRLVEYHISGYHTDFLHYPLFKTQQNQIIEAVQNRNIPFIIESTFDEINGLEKEIEYIERFKF